MADFHVDTSQLDRLGANAAAAHALMPAEMMRAMTKGALKVEGDAKIIVPVKSGTLRRSITHGDITPTEGKVGSNVSYARYVEEGTENADGSVRMAARPYLKTALAKNIAAIQKEFDMAVKRVLAKFGGG